ncbi:uncharacterized protein LOC119723934 isoform X2 [Patiria miniata]|uniref:Uncharacterized protein n=1 Tax=Patiria miniata TaxID=46514 RepID=A0A913ZI92_PATMI|nr:uncharacterized protein LOC119723934 isoform X2 [Patiria miniata]
MIADPYTVNAMFDQTVYLCNASDRKIYVRAVYEKWQKLKLSAELKAPVGGGNVAAGFDYEQASNLSEGFTSVAPHHTLKMIGTFFSAWAKALPPKGVDADGYEAGDDGVYMLKETIRISRNYRVPGNHSIIVTPQRTVQVVHGRKQWKNRCREFCPFMFDKERRFKLPGGKHTRLKEPCPVCGRGERASSAP